MTVKLSKSLLLCLFLAIGSHAVGQSYRLKQATTLEAGQMYVFAQMGGEDEYVMENSITSGKLLTTSSFATKDLTGTEPYVWRLVANGAQFYMLNTANGKYLTKTDGKTDLRFMTKSGSHSWNFDANDDGSFTVWSEKYTQNRFLGFVSATNFSGYKAYNMLTGKRGDPNYPFHITAYVLEETDDGATDVKRPATAMPRQASGTGHDLQGRQSQPGTKGVRIVNGQKTVIR
ncbi:MAG: hypothetical protein IJU11_00065 [Prevotella sp.]|nr:hypothetical protein [Prevotella sp.]